jgi:hypothetical protein
MRDQHPVALGGVLADQLIVDPDRLAGPAYGQQEARTACQGRPVLGKARRNPMVVADSDFCTTCYHLSFKLNAMSFELGVGSEHLHR